MQVDAERRAEQDRARKQAARAWQGQQHRDVVAAARLAHHGDARRITAEGGDIVAHPEQRLLLVEHCEIAHNTVRDAQESECPEPIVDVDDDGSAVARERLAVVPGQRSGAAHEAAAVQPDDDRTRAVGISGCPDGETQTVFGLGGVDRAYGGVDARRGLRRDRSVLRRIQNAAPRGARGRRLEPADTDGHGRIGNAAIDVNPVHAAPGQRA